VSRSFANRLQHCFCVASRSGILRPMSPATPQSSDLTHEPSGYILDGRWRVRPDINRIFDGETELQVPDKLMQVLVVLITRSGVVSRQELFDAVWPDTVVVEESLTRAVSSLRRLLDDDPRSPRVIETIPKKGYRLLVSVRPISTEATPDVPHRSVWRRPWVAALMIGVSAIIAGWWWLAGRDDVSGSSGATELQLTALPGIEEYPTLSPEGDRCAFVWDGNGEEPDGVFVQVLGAAAPLRLTHTPGHYAFPAWTSDSRHIAFARVTGPSTGIFMVPATGGAEIELIAAAGATLVSPAFSPDGRWLVFSSRAAEGGPWRLQRKDLASGRVETLAPSAAVHHGGYRPRFSPDGRRLAFLRIDGNRSAIVITTADGVSPHQVPSSGHELSDIAWTLDGKGLVVGRDDGLEILGLDGVVERVLVRTSHIGAISAAARAPVVVYARGRRERNIWTWTRPATTGHQQAATRIIHTTAWDSSPVFSPDGRLIAFLSDRTGSRQLWLAARDGSSARRMTQLDLVLPVPPAWSPDGDRLAIVLEVGSTPTVGIVETASGRTTLLQPPETGESHVAWSRDGATLLVSRSTAEGSELWRRQIAGSEPSGAVALTHGGGVRAVEAPGGRSLFFTRIPLAREIWQSELDGSNPRVVVSLATGQILTWQVSEHCLYYGYRHQLADRTYRIASFDLESNQTTELLTVPGRLGLHLDVDPTDPSTIVFDQTEALDSDLMAITSNTSF